MGQDSFLSNLVAGTNGGIALTLVGHPFDTVKVRLQTQSATNPQYKGVVDCFSKTLKNEGPMGLYKGVWSPLMGQMFLYALCMTSYEFGKNIQRSSPDEQLNLFQVFNAGQICGVATTVVMTPMELVKIQLQLQQDAATKKYKNPIDCAAKLVKEKGIRGIYKGTAATLIRDVPGSGVYFAGYEAILRSFINEERSRSELTGSHFLFSGGMAGLLGWMFMLPLDTVKSRVQAGGDYKGFGDCFAKILKNEGPMALWKGLPAVVIRSFPSNAAMFFAYETTKKFLRGSSQEDEL